MLQYVGVACIKVIALDDSWKIHALATSMRSVVKVATSRLQDSQLGKFKSMPRSYIFQSSSRDLVGVAVNPRHHLKAEDYYFSKAT